MINSIFATLVFLNAASKNNRSRLKFEKFVKHLREHSFQKFCYYFNFWYIFILQKCLIANISFLLSRGNK